MNNKQNSVKNIYKKKDYKYLYYKYKKKYFLLKQKNIESFGSGLFNNEKYLELFNELFYNEKYLELFNDVSSISNDKNFKENIFKTIKKFATTKSGSKEKWTNWFENNQNINEIQEIDKINLTKGVVYKTLDFLINMNEVVNKEVMSEYYKYQVLLIVNNRLNKYNNSKLRDDFQEKFTNNLKIAFKNKCKADNFMDIQFCLNTFFREITFDIEDIKNELDKTLLSNLVPKLKRNIMQSYIKKECSSKPRPAYCERIPTEKLNNILKLKT